MATYESSWVTKTDFTKQEPSSSQPTTHDTTQWQDQRGVTLRISPKTCSSPRCPLHSHSLVCIENRLFIVGIGPILNKELEFIFQSDQSDRMCVYSIDAQF